MGGRIRRVAQRLPAVPCTIADVPIGACVRAADLPPAWYQLTYRIGYPDRGTCNLRLLTAPPDDLRWIDSPDHCRLARPELVVVEVAWPIRAGDAERAEVTDPLGVAADHGPLFDRDDRDEDKL